MPKIQISEKLLHTLLGRALSFDDLENELMSAKAEIDNEVDEDGNIKIELNDTNRPDLWTIAGIARHLTTYHTKKLHQKFDFFSKEADKNKKIIVDANIKKIRPFVLGFVISGKKIDDVLLQELIQMQEKLCENFGRKRKAIAIGIYRENSIHWPVHYTAVNPKTTSFVPLDFDEEISLEQIVREHPKGKEYGHLLASHNEYPLLRDNDNNVLSMPPIINSANIGAVRVGDDTIFVECTGTHLDQLMLVANILACDCYDFGFDIMRVEIVYPYEIDDKALSHIITKTKASDTESKKTPAKKQSQYSITAPANFQKNMSVRISEIETMLGKKISNDTIQSALTKMNVASEINGESVSIAVPPYRNDFLHSVDIIEDIVIGVGLHTFETQYPKYFTIGRLTEIETMSRKIIATMVGLGFQEMIYPYLGSFVDFIEKIYDEKEHKTIQANMVQISNPISENYEFVRNSIIPNLLESERVSAHSPYPHRMCELGKVACIDTNNVLETRTDTNLGFLIANNTVGFTDINAIVAAIFYYIDIEWSQEVVCDSRFIEGRVGKVIRNNNGNYIEVGIFGEIHPRVLHSFGITMPCVAGEINLEKLL